MSGGVTSVYPITVPRSVQPFSLEEPSAVPSTTAQPILVPCELYAPTWVVFQVILKEIPFFPGVRLFCFILKKYMKVTYWNND